MGWRAVSVVMVLVAAACGGGSDPGSASAPAAAEAAPTAAPTATQTPGAAVEPVDCGTEPVDLGGVVAVGPPIAELAAFDDLAVELIADPALPITQAAIAVMRDGELVFARGYTAADVGDETRPDSLFRIASVSKPITAAAVLELAERGVIDLDDAITEYVPFEYPPIGAGSLQGYQRFDVDPRLDDITIRHLLHHRGGWDVAASTDVTFAHLVIADALGLDRPPTRDETISYAASIELDFDPGTSFAYSNFGYVVLGAVVEAATGEVYEDFVRSEVLGPLGIDDAHVGASARAGRRPNEVSYHTGFPPGHEFGGPDSAYGQAFIVENIASSGGWIMSAVDLARFGHAFRDGADNPVLDSASLETMFARPPGATGPHWYAAGWDVRDVGGGQNRWHAGSVIGTQALVVSRSDDTTWAILLNGRPADDPDGFGLGIDIGMHEAARTVATWPGVGVEACVGS